MRGGRGDWIRTSDRSAPSRVLYQTELLPDRAYAPSDPTRTKTIRVLPERINQAIRRFAAIDGY